MSDDTILDPEDFFVNDPEGYWKKHANCLDADPDLFISSKQNDQEKARTYCRDCPVWIDCLEWGLNSDQVGLLGGLTESERSALKFSSLPSSQFVDELEVEHLDERMRIHEQPPPPHPLEVPVLVWQEVSRRHVLWTTRYVPRKKFPILRLRRTHVSFQ